MLEFDNENEVYQATDTDRTEMLNELSDDILMNNIREQISEKTVLISDTTNVLDIFDQRYDYIVNFFNENDDAIKSAKVIRSDIYNEILLKFEDKFDIDSELENFSTSEDFYFYIKMMYEFFVLNYKEFITNFFIEYIYNNRDYFVRQYKDISNKKDLVFKSLKERFKDNDYIYIIYHLEKIILDIIASNEIENEEVIGTIYNEDEYEIVRNYIYNLFVENKFNTYLGSKFKMNFFNPFLSDEYKDELFAIVRNELTVLFIQLQ